MMRSATVTTTKTVSAIAIVTAAAIAHVTDRGPGRDDLGARDRGQVGLSVGVKLLVGRTMARPLILWRSANTRRIKLILPLTFSRPNVLGA